MNDSQPAQSSFSTGLRCACPRCGNGKLYDGLLRVAKQCTSCGLDYGKLNADDGAAFPSLSQISILATELMRLDWLS